MDLDYRVVYSRRKTIGITVERDASVVVHAPVGTPATRIRAAIESRRLWLYQKTNHIQKYPAHPVRKEFVSGESLLYLGRTYQLHLTDDELPGVRFQSGFYLSRHHRAQASHLLQAWYMERAREKLTPRIERFAQSLGVTYNRILISDLQVRWGSCTPKSNLNFNWRIIKAPLFVTDYIIVHELAHLLEPNHTPHFWTIVSIQVPRYLQARDWLRQNGNLLEQEF